MVVDGRNSLIDRCNIFERIAPEFVGRLYVIKQHVVESQLRLNPKPTTCPASNSARATSSSSSTGTTKGSASAREPLPAGILPTPCAGSAAGSERSSSGTSTTRTMQPKSLNGCDTTGFGFVPENFKMGSLTRISESLLYSEPLKKHMSLLFTNSLKTG